MPKASELLDVAVEVVPSVKVTIFIPPPGFPTSGDAHEPIKDRRSGPRDGHPSNILGSFRVVNVPDRAICSIASLQSLIPPSPVAAGEDRA